MSRLTVLSVAFPFARVGPGSVGGAEQVLGRIERAIVARGHRSLVIAMEGSTCSGQLLPIPEPVGVVDDDARRTIHEACRVAIANAIESGVDVVHMHGVDFAEYLPGEGPALLVTLHLPPSFYPRHVFSLARPKTHYVCVSERQSRLCPQATVPVSVIGNGIDLSELEPTEPKEDYAVALGRICPEKAFHDAIDAAKIAHLPFRLGGDVYPYAEHVAYYREQIVPRLDARRRFIGAVSGPQKKALLARASCLVVPSLVEETSSLVTMEALASGTPVVARRVGSLVDLVDHGRTGFLVSSVDEMAAAISQGRALDPAACRREAERRFGVERMTRAYLELIESLG